MALSVDQILNINDVDEEHRSGVHTYVHTHFPFPLLFFLLVEMCSKKREKKEKGVNYTHEEAGKKTNYSAAWNCIEYQRKRNSHLISRRILIRKKTRDDKYLTFTGLILSDQ